MIDKFDKLCETLLEATSGKKDNIEKAIAQLQLNYGEDAKNIITELLKSVEEHAKRLNDFRMSPQGKRPLKPNQKKLQQALENAKTDIQREQIQKKYDLRLQDYNKTTKYINESIKRLYKDKIDDLFSIYQKIAQFNIPDNKCQLEYVLGNSKVGEDTIIINMGPATICDAAKAGQCDLYLSGNCYAQNNETQYKNAIVKRFREKLQWIGSEASTIATQIADVVTILRKKGNTIRYIRFNESGDFSSREDKIKLGQIVNETNEILKKAGEKKVTFYTYTHRSDLFKNSINDINAPDLIIQGSGTYRKKDVTFFVDNCFMGIEYEDAINIVDNGLLKDSPELREILKIDSKEALPKVVFCRGECFGCGYCKTKDKKLILIAHHGKGTQITVASSSITKQLGELYNSGLKQMLKANELPTELKKTLLSSQYYNENGVIDKIKTYTMYRQTKGSTPGGPPLIDPNSLYPLLMSIREMIESEITNNPKSELKKVVTRFKDPHTGKVLNDDELKKYFESETQKIIKYNQKYTEKKTPEQAEEVVEDNITDDATITESVDKLDKIDLNKTTPLMFANLSVAGLLKKIKGFVPESQINKITDQQTEYTTEQPQQDSDQLINNTKQTIGENIFYKLAKDII